ncbi:MAG: 3-deoxy-manno-octulosonate cytidylyltransferase [Gammaproteobacteria bacterium]
MKTDFVVIIPVRMQASRLPGKPLLVIGDKPLIQHVYERALDSSADRVIIATDSKDIEQVAQGFNAEVVLTSEQPGSGTERIGEACQLLGLAEDRIVVNVQGDEFKLPPALIDQAANNLLRHKQAAMTTLCEAVPAVPAENDPNTVKVAFDAENLALSFSRAPIPDGKDKHWRHIGLYAYRVNFIKQFCGLPPGTLEQREKLEQLRALENGYAVHVEEAVTAPGIGIDTEQDLQQARAYLLR